MAQVRIPPETLIAAFAIQKGRHGGYVVVVGEEIVVARSSLGEAVAWVASMLADKFNEAPYMPQHQQQQPAQPARVPHPQPPPSHEAFDPIPPIPRGVMPNGLVETLRERMNNGSAVASLVMAFGLVLYQLWPFGV
jgi:hypothetical protein